MPLKLDQATNYHYDGFPPAPLDGGRFLANLLRATSAIARYDQMLSSLPNSELLIAPLRDQEAVLSSRIEGTISTVDEIMRYEAEAGETDPASPSGGKAMLGARNDVIETVLYRKALKSGEINLGNSQPITPFFIRSLHQQLLSFGRGKNKKPGSFKTEQNYLADSGNVIRFIPISPEKLPDGLDRFFAFLEQPFPEEHGGALVKTAMAHVEFEALHPFQDGNGRIGRILIPLILWREGVITRPYFYISAFFERHKTAYIDLMRGVSSHQAWEPWCDFFLAAIAEEAERSLKLGRQITACYDEMKERFTRVLASQWSVAALDRIFQKPIFRIDTLTQTGEISRASAQRFVQVLLKEGIITTIYSGSGRRPALYEFRPLLELIEV